MKKTDRTRLALQREVVRVLAELPVAALRQARGGTDKTTPDGGCASSTSHSAPPTGIDGFSKIAGGLARDVVEKS
jgi:hypothetical protein